jgi:glycine/D-amino acid oxidase-like deaminating enzyme
LSAIEEGYKGAAPNRSYWLSAIDTENLEPPLEGAREAEVVLLGGGYTSLVTAYFLKRARPDAEVVVLESDYVGFGASGRNAGMVLHEPHLQHLRRFGERAVRFTYEQTVRAVDAIEELSRQEDFDCELERTGYLAIGFYPAHRARLEATARACRRLGIDLPLWDPEQVQAAIRSERFTSALVFPRAAVLHPGKYISGLERACKRAGVKIFERSPAIGIEPRPEIVVSTDRGKLRARYAVLGLNAYLPSARLRVIRDRAVALKSFIILTEPLADEHWKSLGWAGRQGYSDLRRIHNYVRLTGKRILFGGRVVYHFGVQSPAEEEAFFARLHRELLTTFPSLRDVAITHRWSGPVAITPKRTPVVGRAGKHRNIFYALGYSGMGVSLATLCGQVLADVILGKEEAWQDLIYLRHRPWPLPPEPLRFLGFSASYYGMRLADAVDARS